MIVRLCEIWGRDGKHAPHRRGLPGRDDGNLERLQHLDALGGAGVVEPLSNARASSRQSGRVHLADGGGGGATECVKPRLEKRALSPQIRALIPHNLLVQLAEAKEAHESLLAFQE
jgi:hypothetical protein